MSVFNSPILISNRDHVNKILSDWENCFRGDFMHKNVPDKPIEKDELPVPEEIYPVIDNDLARDNIENDIPAADLEDLLPKARGGDWNGK